MLLDDTSPLVRQAMAEVFARSAEAPAAIVQALSLDQPSVALPVLEHSPLLIDADLVDIVATGNCETQCAIARRINLPASVGAAIAEVGTAAAAARADRECPCGARAILLGPHRRAPRPSRRDPRIDAGARRPSRRDARGAGRKTLGHAGAVRGCPKLAQRRPGRADRRRSARPLDASISRPVRAATTCAAWSRICARPASSPPGLILRALLSGNLELFDAALAELSGLPQARVTALLHDRGGDRPAGAAAARRPAGIDVRGVPRGAGGMS